MISLKELFLHFVIKTVRSLPREWRHRLDGVKIDVVENGLRYGKEGRRIMGYWYRKDKHIVYYAPFDLFSIAPDPYEALRGIEKLVRHEIFHATGVSKEEWAQFEKRKPIK